MAITFVGSHVGTHASTSAQTVTFATALRNESNNLVTALQTGDIVLVAVENASTVNRTQAQLTPSGYTAAHADNYQNDSNDSNFLVSYKVMGATPDTTVSIPASNATTAGVGYAIYVFRGVDTVTPMDVAPVVAGAINTGVADAAAITPATSGAWIAVFAGAAVAAGAVFTNPAGMSATTNHFRSATITTTTNDANIGGALYTAWASGSYDPAVFGGSTSTNTGSWSAVTIALRPYLAPIVSTLGVSTLALVGQDAATIRETSSTLATAVVDHAGQIVASVQDVVTALGVALLANAGQTMASTNSTISALTAATLTAAGAALASIAATTHVVTAAVLANVGAAIASVQARVSAIAQALLNYGGQEVITDEGAGSSTAAPQDTQLRIAVGGGV